MKLRVIDFETTGFKPPAAQVIEYGLCDLDHDGHLWTVGRPVSRLCGVTDVPAEVRAVHHIRASDVAGLEPFDPAEPILDANAHGVIAMVAHNWDFEAQFLGDHALPVLCTLKAASRVWPDAPRHTNGVLRYWLEDQGLLSLDDELATPPHRAGPDAYVTAHILKALLATGATGKDMVAWTREPRVLRACPIGKFRDKPWPEVDAGFLNWMLAQESMEADLKWNAQRELDRRNASHER